ncbi:hypothetical protein BJY52DRAFT_299838 [Lactarius psammicola]|nr:hypothetical protein BJY52DRAFT_299838 [Lactarius psammicola]
MLNYLPGLARAQDPETSPLVAQLNQWRFRHLVEKRCLFSSNCVRFTCVSSRTSDSRTEDSTSLVTPSSSFCDWPRFYAGILPTSFTLWDDQLIHAFLFFGADPWCHLGHLARRRIRCRRRYSIDAQNPKGGPVILFLTGDCEKSCRTHQSDRGVIAPDLAAAFSLPRKLNIWHEPRSFPETTARPPSALYILLPHEHRDACGFLPLSPHPLFYPFAYN